MKTILLPRIFSAHLTSLRPKTIDILDEAPTPIKEQKACITFIIGKVMARPAIAKALTTCPMKILSTILYNEAII